MARRSETVCGECGSVIKGLLDQGELEGLVGYLTDSRVEFEEHLRRTRMPKSPSEEAGDIIAALTRELRSI